MNKVPALLTSITVAGIMLFSAAPAYAAGTLPEGDSLYAITCDESDVGLFGVDPASAAGTLVGLTAIAGDCGGPAAWDPTTGTGYYISWGDDDQLALLDITTGVATPVAIFTEGDEYPDSLAIGNDGAAYTISGSSLYSVDLDTAVQTVIGTLSDRCLYGFAVDPTTGTFYAVQCDTGAVYIVDVTTATLTQIGSITDVDVEDDGHQDIYALQIDSAGRWWIEADGNGNSSIFNLANPIVPSASVLSGIFVVNVTSVYTESLLITPAAVEVPAPAPALASTGRDSSLDGLLVGGTAALLLGGIALFIYSGRRRSQLG